MLLQEQLVRHDVCEAWDGGWGAELPVERRGGDAAEVVAVGTSLSCGEGQAPTTVALT